MLGVLHDFELVVVGVEEFCGYASPWHLSRLYGKFYSVLG